jgi:hypothetical protein
MFVEGGHMRWRTAVLDATELLQRQCSQADYDEFCKGQEESQECLDQCG